MLGGLVGMKLVMAYKTFLTFDLLWLICEIVMIIPTLLSCGEAHQEEFNDLLHIRDWSAGKLSLSLQIFCWFHTWSIVQDVGFVSFP